MKRSLITYSIAAVVTALAVISCTDESEEQYSGDVNGIFRLSSGQEAFTRATESTFKPGTAYQLYAIEGTDFSTNYLKNPAGKGVVTGWEADDNNSITGIDGNEFNYKILNFYGVTNSTDVPVEIIDGEGDAPTCFIEYGSSNQPLTDVMWTKKENQTYQNSGTIKLLFGHTLSKLNLYIMKNNDYDDQTVKLKSISLLDYPSGSLNMGTGKFVHSANDKRNHEVSVLSNVNQEITTDAITVEDASGAVTPMIFPTRKEDLEASDRANHSLKVKVTVQVGNNSPTEQETEITSILAEDPGHNYPEIPFEFKSNHEYDMVITVTGSSLVVTIVPRVYEWIPEEEVKIDSDVNGSMTIGGITWMDRNLGATSGDPLASEQAWENSRGYYYQFGRNIPYYIKTYRDKQGIVSVYSNGKDKSKATTRPFPFIPGHMNDGALYNGNTPDIAINPTDKNKKFNYYYYNSDWFYGADWNTDHTVSGATWTSTNSQPCPKGWRIPTKDEYLLILPGEERCGDISFMLQAGNEPNKYYIHPDNTYSETVSENGYDTQYVGVRKGYKNGTVGKTGTVYALKKKGSDDAYYLRWHIEQAGNKSIDNEGDGDKYRNVLVISRYPATGNDNLTTTNVFLKNWNNPVDILKMPLSGYINANDRQPGIIYSGSEVVYWTSTTNGNVSYTMRAKFAGDSNSNSIYMNKEEFRHNGALIRCVRDTKAN
ncbi:hypothetical protein [Bacteroides sp.]